MNGWNTFAKSILAAYMRIAQNSILAAKVPNICSYWKGCPFGVKNL